MLLDEDVEHLAMLIDRRPEIHLLPTDARERLVQMPRPPSPCLAPPQLVGVARSELRDLAPNRLVADLDAASSEQLLDVAVAQANRKYGRTAWAITSAGK